MPPGSRVKGCGPSAAGGLDGAGSQASHLALDLLGPGSSGGPEPFDAGTQQWPIIESRLPGQDQLAMMVKIHTPGPPSQHALHPISHPIPCTPHTAARTLHPTQSLHPAPRPLPAPCAPLSPCTLHPTQSLLPAPHSVPAPCTLHPAPSTPPTPCTLHPAPCTPPTLCTLHPAPCTLHPTPCTPLPACTLHPAPCTPLSPCTLRPTHSVPAPCTPLTQSLHPAPYTPCPQVHGEVFSLLPAPAYLPTPRTQRVAGLVGLPVEQAACRVVIMRWVGHLYIWVIGCVHIIGGWATMTKLELLGLKCQLVLSS